MAASGGQRSPFGFEEAFKGEDAFKEGRCIQGGIRRHSRGINADTMTDRHTLPQPAKLDLYKKSLPKQKTIQNFTTDAQGFRRGKISSFSEPLGINSKVLNSLLLG